MIKKFRWWKKLRRSVREDLWGLLLESSTSDSRKRDLFSDDVGRIGVLDRYVV